MLMPGPPCLALWFSWSEMGAWAPDFKISPLTLLRAGPLAPPLAHHLKMVQGGGAWVA